MAECNKETSNGLKRLIIYLTIFFLTNTSNEKKSKKHLYLQQNKTLKAYARHWSYCLR